MLPPSKVHSITQLLDLLQDSDPEFLNQMKDDPLKTIQGIAEQPGQAAHDIIPMPSRQLPKETRHPEYGIYRLLICCLCGIVIIIIIGVIYAWLTKNSREAPTLITAVACTTLGLLAGIFVSVPGKKTPGARRA